MAETKREGEVSVDVFCVQEEGIIGHFEGQAGTLNTQAFLKGFRPVTDEYRFAVSGPKDRRRTIMDDSQAVCPKCKGALMLVPAGGVPSKDGVYLVPNQIKLEPNQ